MSRSLRPSLLIASFALAAQAAWAATPSDYLRREVEVRIVNESKPRAEKEAVIVLPGLTPIPWLQGQARRTFAQTLPAAGYDLFVPKYFARASLEASTPILRDFMNREHLGEYRAVHMLVYIAGGWIVNPILNANEFPNVRSVVYDRGPVQEIAPQILTRRLPTKPYLALYRGAIIPDLARDPYIPMTNPTPRVGIMVETKAAAFIARFQEKRLREIGYTFAIDALHQPHQDIIFARLNHDEFYSHANEVVCEFLTFVEQGRFSDAYPRTYPEDNNPFADPRRPAPGSPEDPVPSCLGLAAQARTSQPVEPAR